MFSPLDQAVRRTLAAALLLVGTAASAQQGAAIFIAGEATGNLDVFNQHGARLDGGPVDFNVSDGFAVGDVDGVPGDEIVIAGDVSGEVEIRRVGSVDAPPTVFPANFTFGDALAVGDVLPGNADEILIAGEGMGYVDIFTAGGTQLAHVFVDYTSFDGFAVGDVDGDGRDEILVAGDGFGFVDVFRADGTLIAHLDLGFTIADGFAVGNVDGVGADEIVIAGNGNHEVEIFDFSGTLLSVFDSGFTISDALAVGDVDGDGRDDIAIAGDVSGDVDVFDMAGNKIHHFDGDFSVLDGFAIGRNAWPDLDADGLLDAWELNGYDDDGDTIIDVDLPGMGCKWNHKDLLLELDWQAGVELKRFDIQLIKEAFALAPIDAGGTPNPDLQPGIHLVIDTGAGTDPTALEGITIPDDSCENGLDDDFDGTRDDSDVECDEGTAAGSCRNGMDDDGDGKTDDKDPDCREGKRTCGDGVDNNFDGVEDAADPLCLIGDNYGGGNEVAGPVDPLGSDFYATKQANFDKARRRLFRYGVSAISNGYDTGGRGEIGGNDFVEYNWDAGTIMHEFGHNLNLRHGGADDSNCKPNYVSVMNYDHQFGIPRVPRPGIIDYSPPRRVDGSRGGKLPTLNEWSLDESIILDPDDSSTLFMHTDRTDGKIRSRLDQPVDWTGNGDTSETDVAVNIDDEDAEDQPAACENVTVTGVLEGHEDWPVIQFTFRGHADYDDAAVNPVMERELTRDDLLRHQRILNRANLQVTLTDSVDPAAAGETVQLTAVVRNLGPNPSDASHLRVELPAGVTHVGTPGCLFGQGVLACDIDQMFPGDERTFVTTLAIDADLVHVAGGPVTLSTLARVTNVTGDDPQPLNNAATETTQVVAKADLEVEGVTVAGVPQELLIGDTAAITVHERVTSHGPSTPMDARVTRTAAVPADVTIAFGAASVLVPALAKDEVREISTSVEVACTAPGKRTFSLTSSIAPDRPDDLDPNPSNDFAGTSFEIECVVPVGIRVMPTMKEGRRGVVPVEIRSNEAGEDGLPVAFSAPLIDATSVRFASRTAAWFETGGAFEAHSRTHGGEDRVLHFPAQETGLDGTEAEACVKGTYTEPGVGTFKFFGCDAIRW